MVHDNGADDRMMHYVVPVRLVFYSLVGLPNTTLTSKTVLPDDARVLDVRYDPQYRAFVFLVESKTFDPVCDGCVVPETHFEYEIVMDDEG